MGSTTVSAFPTLCAIILLLTFAAYLPAVSSGFIWDDDAYVTDNPLLRDGDGLLRIWTTAQSPQYYPLVFSTFWVEYQLWGLEPSGYHASNILLHALVAIMVGRVLSGLGVPGSWWIAVLFAVHPVHVESVAWVTERKNVLSGLFYMLALAAYFRFEERGRRRLYWIALGLFLCALLSKTVTATLPVVIAGVIYVRRGSLRRVDLLRLAPFLAVAAGMAGVTVALERSMVAVVSYDFELSWIQRGLIACRALLFYVQKLFVPYPLIFNYPRWSIDALTPAWWLPPIVIVGAFAALVALWRRGQRAAVGAVAFFAVTLFPALGFIDVYPFRYSFVADHFQYLASIGILALAVYGGRRLAAWGIARSGAPAARRRLVGVIAGVLATMTLATLTWNQCRAYENAETLWLDTVAKNPDSWLAHNSLGMLQLERGELDAALASMEQALRSNPGSTESHTARGMVRARMDQLQPALDDYNEALRLDATYPQAYIHRGELFQRLRRHEDVLADFGRVLESRADYLPAYKARGQALVSLGRFDEAVAEFSRALEHGANFEALYDRGDARLRQGDFRAALADFSRAIEAQPDALFLYHSRGLAYAKLRDAPNALADFNRVLTTDPNALSTLRMRGMLYLQAFRDHASACADWARACRLGDCTDLVKYCQSEPGG